MLLSTHLLRLWEHPDLLANDNANMASINPEWDFMSRTFLVLGSANLILRKPELKQRLLVAMDRIIEDTLRIESERGFSYFLMSYGKTQQGWVQHPPRSVFVDGEIALMLAARRLIEEKLEYKPLLAARISRLVAQMGRSPVLSGESYPDECWLFCNTVALAAIRMSDILDRTDHSRFLQRWVNTSRQYLLHAPTGLLISAFTVSGQPARCGRRPEGSSIWMAAHMLQIVDPGFAQDQYQRARKELGRSFLGFGFSREWPGWRIDYQDVDSGPVLPVIGASASASGLAIMAARAFHDDRFYASLMASLSLAGCPRKRGEALTYEASNTVGEAVIFYGLIAGPLWNQILERSR